MDQLIPFFLRKLLTGLILPPVGPILVAAAGLLLLKRLPRFGRVLAWTGVLTLLALSLPLVSNALLYAVAHDPPLDFARARGAGAIVILGGGVRSNAPEYGGETLGRLSLERVRYGALVARKTRLPVLVSGGAVYDDTPEAELMQRALREEFGIDVKWAEVESRNTHQNAIESAKILHKAGIRDVILVAHGFDMPRALAEFKAAGLSAVAAPTVIAHGRVSLRHDLVPSVPSLLDSYFALYELLGRLALRLGL